MKKLIILFLILPLFLAACSGNQTSETDTETETPATETPAEVPYDDKIIVPDQRVGLITPENCSPKGILATYGKYAKIDSVYIAQGTYGKGVVVYPDDLRNKLEIYWDNQIDSIKPAFIRIIGDSTGTDWKTNDGVTIGTPIAEIQRLNGKQFYVSGFGLDYGGYPVGWNGGKFSTSVLFRFLPTVGTAGLEKISGEGSFSSDLPEMVAAKPAVKSMLFRFLIKEKLPDCIMEKVKAQISPPNRMKVIKVNVNGVDHYWLRSGAVAFDGIEYIYDSSCKEVCRTGGMQTQMTCMKSYENVPWTVVWEE